MRLGLFREPGVMISGDLFGHSAYVFIESTSEIRPFRISAFFVIAAS